MQRMLQTVLVASSDIIEVLDRDNALATLQSLQARGELDFGPDNLAALADKLADGELLLVRPEVRVLDAAWQIAQLVPALVTGAGQ